MAMAFDIVQNKNKIFLSLALIVSLIFVFYLGFVYGTKDAKEANFQPKVTSVLANGNQENSLSQIKIRDIIGTPNTKDRLSVGKFYFAVKNEDENNIYTDLLFKIDSAPSKILNSDAKKEIEIPLELNIDLATRTPDGQTFEYETIGNVKLVPSESKKLKLDFSGVIPFALDQKSAKTVQRIVFRSPDPEKQNVYVDNDPNLPLNIRGDKGLGVSGENAPYFWVDI